MQGNWTGDKDSGSRSYTAAQFERVVQYLLASPGPTTYQKLSRETKVGGRTLRKILSEADGNVLVLIRRDPYVGKANWREEMESGNRYLMSQIQAMVNRIERRKQFAEQHLPMHDKPSNWTQYDFIPRQWKRKKKIPKEQVSFWDAVD